MAKSKRVIVTVDDAGLGNIAKVRSKLSAKGMHVRQVMPMTGVIAGSCPIAKVDDLRSVQGVSSVEEELDVQLPPNDAEVQ